MHRMRMPLHRQMQTSKSRRSSRPPWAGATVLALIGFDEGSTDRSLAVLLGGGGGRCRASRGGFGFASALPLFQAGPRPFLVFLQADHQRRRQNGVAAVDAIQTNFENNLA